jgi:hypothetical protein
LYAAGADTNLRILPASVHPFLASPAFNFRQVQFGLLLPEVLAFGSDRYVLNQLCV